MDLGLTPSAVFLDLSKAFDTLDHNIMIEKLRHYGIENKSLNWFVSYLEKRQQFVEFQNKCSEISFLSTGVPQGSILGPLLFNIYVNDIKNATQHFNIIQYADDTSLISSSCDSVLINDELSKVQQWLILNKLSLNITKTKYMVFSPRSKKIQLPNLTLNNTPIEHVNQFDFLGVVLDENVKWDKHINKVGNKINRNIGLISKLKYYLSVHTLKTLYNSLILRYFNYGILAWGLSTSSKRLVILQKKAARILTKSKFNAHSNPILKSLKLLKVPDLYRLQVLKFYYKYVHSELPDFFQSFVLKKRSHVHPYSTSKSSDLISNRTKHKFADACLKNQIPVIMNNTADNIISKLYTHSFNGYSKYIETKIIECYSTECTLDNCYICSVNE